MRHGLPDVKVYFLYWNYDGYEWPHLPATASFSNNLRQSSRTVQAGRVARLYGRSSSTGTPRHLKPHEYGKRIESHPRHVCCPYPAPAHLPPEVQHDRGLGDPETCLVRVGKELYIEGVPVAKHLRERLLQRGVGEYLEPCLGVAERQPEERLQRSGIDPAHDLPWQRIPEAGVRVVLGADHDVGLLIPHGPEEALYLAGVQVKVGVKEYDEIPFGYLEPFAERVALAPVPVQAERHYIAEILRCPPGLRGGSVNAAVVHEDYLEGAARSAKDPVGLPEVLIYVMPLVESGHDYRYFSLEDPHGPTLTTV